MNAVDAICFDPVGTFADFPIEPFRDLLWRAFGRTLSDEARGSHAYWKLLELIATSAPGLVDQLAPAIETAELEAVNEAFIYDDAGPALGELTDLGIRLLVASSLSERPLARFFERSSFGESLRERWSRDATGGVGDAVLRRAVASAQLIPGRVLFLTDTEQGLSAARRAGMLPILMMNEPEEAMRLTACEPAGGIVSLHELPDLVRLVGARRGR